jgi:hypothetical protein
MMVIHLLIWTKGEKLICVLVDLLICLES